MPARHRSLPVAVVACLLLFGMHVSSAFATDSPPVPKRAKGVVRSQTYADALARARRDKRDLIVLVHGSDWCRIGEIFRTSVWEKREFERRLGQGFILFEADVPEHPDEEQKKKLAERQKGCKTKFGNYPVLVFVDPEGKLYATVTGTATTDQPGFPADVSQAVHTITSLHRAREIRDAYLARAEKAPPGEKAELLFRAWQTNAGRRQEILDRLRAADPEDRRGYLARLDFNGYALLEKAKSYGDTEKYEEGVRWLNDQLARKGLQPEQKQWILTALGNLYRRWLGHEQQAWETLTKSIRIDPDSMMGRAAKRIGLRFVGPPSLDFGWFPRHGNTESQEWIIEASEAFPAPGEYTLTLAGTKGKSSLHIQSVLLVDGNRTIAESTEAMTVGPTSPQASIRLHVPRALRHPILKITCRTEPGTDSTGTITLEPSTDRGAK